MWLCETRGRIEKQQEQPNIHNCNKTKQGTGRGIWGKGRKVGGKQRNKVKKKKQLTATNNKQLIGQWTVTKSTPAVISDLEIFTA